MSQLSSSASRQCRARAYAGCCSVPRIIGQRSAAASKWHRRSFLAFRPGAWSLLAFSVHPRVLSLIELARRVNFDSVSVRLIQLDPFDRVAAQQHGNERQHLPAGERSPSCSGPRVVPMVMMPARELAPAAPIPGDNAAAQARTDVDVNEVGGISADAAELGLV